MTDLNPLEIIRDRLGDYADDWLFQCIRKYGAHEAESFLWRRVSEVESAAAEILNKAHGMSGRVGTEA